MKTVLTKGVILVSGGLDSTTLMYQFVAQNVEFVHFSSTMVSIAPAKSMIRF